MIQYFINNILRVTRGHDDIIPRVGDSVHLIWNEDQSIGDNRKIVETNDKMVTVEQILYIVNGTVFGSDTVTQVKVFCK